MIQAITRGNTTYIEAPIDEFKAFVKQAMKEVGDELIRSLPKQETKVLPLPVWKSTEMLMNPNSPDYLGIKSASGFASWRKMMFAKKALKMEKRGKENWYLITEK